MHKVHLSFSKNFKYTISSFYIFFLYLSDNPQKFFLNVDLKGKGQNRQEIITILIVFNFSHHKEPSLFSFY